MQSVANEWLSRSRRSPPLILYSTFVTAQEHVQESAVNLEGNSCLDGISGARLPIETIEKATCATTYSGLEQRRDIIGSSTTVDDFLATQISVGENGRFNYR